MLKTLTWYVKEFFRFNFFSKFMDDGIITFPLHHQFFFFKANRASGLGCAKVNYNVGFMG